MTLSLGEIPIEGSFKVLARTSMFSMIDLSKRAGNCFE